MSHALGTHIPDQEDVDDAEVTALFYLDAGILCPRNTPACARYARRRVFVLMCCLQVDRGDSEGGVKKKKPISSSLDKRRPWPIVPSTRVPPCDIPDQEDVDDTEQLRSPAWTPACICPRNTPACARYARRRVIVWMCCLQFDRGDSDAGVKNKPISSSSSVDKRRPSSSSATVPPRDIPVSEDAEVSPFFWLHAGVCCSVRCTVAVTTCMKARRRDYMIYEYVLFVVVRVLTAYQQVDACGFKDNEASTG